MTIETTPVNNERAASLAYQTLTSVEELLAAYDPDGLLSFEIIEDMVFIVEDLLIELTYDIEASVEATVARETANE